MYVNLFILIVLVQGRTRLELCGHYEPQTTCGIMQPSGLTIIRNFYREVDMERYFRFNLSTPSVTIRQSDGVMRYLSFDRCAVEEPKTKAIGGLPVYTLGKTVCQGDAKGFFFDNLYGVPPEDREVFVASESDKCDASLSESTRSAITEQVNHVLTSPIQDPAATVYLHVNGRWKLPDRSSLINTPVLMHPVLSNSAFVIYDNGFPVRMVVDGYFRLEITNKEYMYSCSDCNKNTKVFTKTKVLNWKKGHYEEVMVGDRQVRLPTSVSYDVEWTGLDFTSVLDPVMRMHAGSIIGMLQSGLREYLRLILLWVFVPFAVLAVVVGVCIVLVSCGLLTCNTLTRCCRKKNAVVVAGCVTSTPANEVTVCGRPVSNARAVVLRDRVIGHPSAIAIV
eukprot:Platyproteum_vivax@DN1905_c0_g1_i1.p1